MIPGTLNRGVEPLRILFYDIETAPGQAFVWSAKTRYVPHTMMIHPPFMLCWAAKWAGNRTIISSYSTPKEVLDKDDKRIVEELADLLREADIIVAHNGDRFDLPMLNNRILVHDLEPLGPIQTIDTLKLARRDMRLMYNKLDHIAQELQLGNKISTSFDLWRDVYYGDEKAMAKMLRYNKKDVTLLEQVFNKMKPHVKRLTRLIEGAGEFCPHCGAGASLLIRRGFYRTQASTFVKYQCANCKRYHRARKSEPRKSTVHPL